MPIDTSQPNTGGMEEFLKQLQLGEQNRQNQGTLDISRQASERENQLQPLKLDELKAKIEEQRITNQNKDAYIKSQIASNLALGNQRNSGASGLGTGGKEQIFYQHLVGQDNPHLNNDPAKIYEASNVYANGGDTLSDGTKLNPLSPAARNSLDRITKSGNTSQGLNQQRFAATTDALINKADENAEAAMKYSGLLGGAEGSSERLAEVFGNEQSPDYQKYIQFTRTDVPFIAGELMRELGVNASDEQKRMYKDIINPVKWDVNPKLAMAAWNHFKEMVKSVGNNVSKSPSEIQTGLRNPKKEKQPQSSEGESGGEEGDFPVNPGKSQAASMANKMELPKFNSAEEFNSWFGRQPKVVQSAVALYLKKKKGNK